MSTSNVNDLFQHPQLQHTIAEKVKRSGGEGVALWLEAWDELQENNRQKSSVFLNLVHRHILPKATVIITSRPWATENLKATSRGIDQHIEIISTPAIQFHRILNEDKVRPDAKDELRGYVDKNLSVKAAMHTPVTADIVAEVFQWSQDTESSPPRTTTQLYKTLTCKLLSVRMGSLEEVAAERKGLFLKMCRLAWEGIIKKQLTFSESDVLAALGGDTLRLMEKVEELYGGEDGQFSYHFIHLTLQEFLSAYHITQLPQDKQDQVIRKHVKIGHLNMVVRFYFGLTQPNHFTSAMISEHLTAEYSGEATTYHWLFEAGDGVPEELGFNKEVSVRSSYSWNPLDYYAVGHCISHYQFQWKLDFSSASMGDEGMETLCKGMASNTRTTHSGEIEGNFFDNHITSDGLKWFLEIPIQILHQITGLELIQNELDGPALNTFCEAIPNLTSLQVLFFSNNPIGKGGAVEVLKYLRQYKAPLKKLELRDTGVGKEDCAQLSLLINLEDHSLTRLDIGNNPDIGAAALGDMITDDTALEELFIDRCGLTSQGFVTLTAKLISNTSLKTLWLGGSLCGTEGAKAIHKMLQENKTLEKLYLENNDSLTNEDVSVIMAGLQYNTTLTELWLPGNTKVLQTPECGGDRVRIASGNGGHAHAVYVVIHDIP